MRPRAPEMGVIAMRGLLVCALLMMGCTSQLMVGQIPDDAGRGDAAAPRDAVVHDNAVDQHDAATQPDSSPPDAAAGTFTATGAMTAQRLSHTATLLPSGKVLLAGGSACYYTGCTHTSAELYDPATGTFSTTGALATARWGHTATLLPSGKVLLVGGIPDTGITASAELYDPATGDFSTTGSLATARYHHTATLLPSGRVLVAGGYTIPVATGVLASAELYDPQTGTFADVGPLTVAGAGWHTATLLLSGEVLVTGGCQWDGSTCGPSSAELYDPDTDTFADAGPMMVPRAGHAAVLLLSGKVLLAGGESAGTAELFDPATGTFSATGPLGNPLSESWATLLPSGEVLVGGACEDCGLAAAAELYDPTKGRFSPTGSPTTARRHHEVTQLASGDVLFSGGGSACNCGEGGGVSAYDSAELYHSK